MLAYIDTILIVKRIVHQKQKGHHTDVILMSFQTWLFSSVKHKIGRIWRLYGFIFKPKIIKIHRVSQTDENLISLLWTNHAVWFWMISSKEWLTLESDILKFNSVNQWLNFKISWVSSSYIFTTFLMRLCHVHIENFCYTKESITGFVTTWGQTIPLISHSRTLLCPG